MKTKMKNETIAKILQKKNHILIWGILLVILIGLGLTIYFFSQNVNKNLNLGNNLNKKTNQEIEEYILNISSYEAEIEVTIESNKNTTKYRIKQNYVSPNIEKQVVEDPSNIKGLETIYDGSKLTIQNTKLNLTKVYENYTYLTDHYLWLNSFITDYQTAKSSGKNSKMYEENNMLIMEVKLEHENPYISYKKLFIDKTTGKITKLIVQDKNQKNLVHILYNEIKINSIKKEEILAFQIEKGENDLC